MEVIFPQELSEVSVETQLKYLRRQFLKLSERIGQLEKYAAHLEILANLTDEQIAELRQQYTHILQE